MLLSIVSKRSSRSSSRQHPVCRVAGAARSVVEAMERRLFLYGTLDPTFGGEGHVEMNSNPLQFGSALAVQADGNTTIGGTNGDFVPERLNANGATAPASNTTIQNTTITENMTVSGGSLTLRNVDVRADITVNGGGVLTLDHVKLSGYTVVYDDGAYTEDRPSTVTVTGGTVILDSDLITTMGELDFLPGTNLLQGNGHTLNTFLGLNDVRVENLILDGGSASRGVVTFDGVTLKGSIGSLIGKLQVVDRGLLFTPSSTIALSQQDANPSTYQPQIEWLASAPAPHFNGGIALYFTFTNYHPTAADQYTVITYQQKTGSFNYGSSAVVKNSLAQYGVKISVAEGPTSVVMNLDPLPEFATLMNGVLHVFGSTEDDTFTVDEDNPSGPTIIRAVVGSFSPDLVRNYTRSAITSIVIDGGNGNDAATYRGQRNAVSINGGDGNDMMNAYGAKNVVAGGIGNDAAAVFGDLSTVTGGEGNDTVFGYGQRDSLDGGAGNDQLALGAGSVQSTVLGNKGDDVVAGGYKNDYLDGGDGNDTLYGYTGDDTLLGGAGNDNLNAAEGNDVLDGWTGNDTLLGGSGNDSLSGYTGDDYLYGSSGSDTLFGGSSNDLYVFGPAGSLENDVINEQLGGGIDTLDFTALGTNVGVDLTGNTIATHANRTLAAQTSGLGANLENVLGGSGSDTLRGNAKANFLIGNAGDDWLLGLDGNDTLDAGYGLNGADVFSGGAGSDTVDYSKKSSAVYVDFADADDGIPGEKDDVWGDVETILGSASGDTIIAATNPNGAPVDYAVKLIGNAGNDYLVGGAGNDTLQGGAGLDRLIGNAGRDLLQGDADNDTLLGADGEKDTLDGGTGTDSLASSDAVDVKISVP